MKLPCISTEPSSIATAPSSSPSSKANFPFGSANGGLHWSMISRTELWHASRTVPLNKTNHALQQNPDKSTLRRNRPNGHCQQRRLPQLVRNRSYRALRRAKTALFGNGETRHYVAPFRTPYQIPLTRLLRRHGKY